MRSPSHTSTVLLGIGIGMIIVPYIFQSMNFPSVINMSSDAWFQYQRIMIILGISFTAAGLIFGFYDTLTYRKELKKPTIKTEPSEKIVHVSAGFRPIKNERPSQGIWYITDRRLIYEGSKPRLLGSEPESLSFLLDNLTNVEIIKLGMFRKCLEATFMAESVIGEEVPKKVQIICKNLETFRDKLQELKSNLQKLEN